MEQAKRNESQGQAPERSIPVYSASGHRLPVVFPNFDAAEEFQRRVIADLSPSLLAKYVGICRDEHPDKIGRPMFKGDETRLATRTDR